MTAFHPLVDILAQAKPSKNQASNCANAGNSGLHLVCNMLQIFGLDVT
tara:strand:- start:10603 stop:10746 length:144 start_codon:yes stop_codon:yes gene_type:complete